MKTIVIHLIDTIKYRLDHAISLADEKYAGFELGAGTRTPLEVIYHMRGLMYYSMKVYTGDRVKMDEMTNWKEELTLLHESIADLRSYTVANEGSIEQYKKLTQGPLADALTHIGQLAMISRVNQQPIEKQNFVHAKIGESHE